MDRVEETYDGTDAIKRQMATGVDFNDRTWAVIKALYDGEIEYADYTARELVRVARRETDDPLIIVAVGDHGELFGEYGLLGHSLVLHDGLTRVPGLVVGIEDVVDDSGSVTQHIDLTHTIASITGVLDEQFQGRDLRSHNREYAVSQRGVADFSAYQEYDPSFNIPHISSDSVTSIRTTSHKLLSSDSETALYGLPDETTDLYDERPDVASRLHSYLENEQIVWPDPKEEKIAFDESTESRLRELGYL